MTQVKHVGDLEIGKTYLVEAEDCCLNIHYIGEVETIDIDPWPMEVTFKGGTKIGLSNFVATEL